MLTLIASAVLAASDLSGVWIGQLPARNGDLQDIAFQFVQKGTKLSGKLYGDYHSSPITEGIVAGHLITFIVMAQEQAGNQINETRLRFTGSIKDGQIELIRERESSRNAGNSGEVMSRGNARQSFKLKKLY
ncbi:MAG: hypothetical protein ACRD44_11180 [Bryobacteraceae bacterium]